MLKRKNHKEARTPPNAWSFCWRQVLYLQDSQVEEDYVKSYLRQNEDCSPRDSLSDISEELLQQGNGRARIHRSFCEKTETRTNLHSRTSKDYY